MITLDTFLQRRQRLLASMAPGSAALIFAAPEVTRSADSEYPYRQNSDFWYFTGFNEPEALLVLIKSDDTHKPPGPSRGQRVIQSATRFRSSLDWIR